MPKLQFIGYNNDYGVSDITVIDLRQNDRLLTKPDVILEKNQFCKNIQIISKANGVK